MKIFIIRLNVSKKITYQRVFKRNKGKVEHFNNEIDRWIREWKEFGKKIKSNIIITNEKNLNLKPLFEKLDKLVDL